MPIIQVGVTHRNTSNANLAKLSERKDQLLASLNASDVIDGAILLATCNRFELYVDAKKFHSGVETVKECVAEIVDESMRQVAYELEMRVGELAVQHLFEVASGLDAVVVGEREVAGQVRRALTEYSKVANAKLNRLFQAALTTSKAVKNNTELGSAGKSLASVGLDLVDEQHGGIRGRDVLVLGTGDYAGVVVSELTQRGAGEIKVASASGRAESFAKTHPRVEAIGASEEEFLVALANAEIIVCCSGRVGNRISVELLEKAGVNRYEVLPIVDLALPGDVDPAVAELAHVAVITLSTIAENVPPEQAKATQEAERIVQQGVETYAHVEGGRRADPAVTAIRRYVSEIIDKEIEKAEHHYSPETAEAVARSLHRVSNALLHAPSVRANKLAKKGDLDSFTNALQTIFGIEVEVNN